MYEDLVMQGLTSTENSYTRGTYTEDEQDRQYESVCGNECEFLYLYSYAQQTPGERVSNKTDFTRICTSMRRAEPPVPFAYSSLGSRHYASRTFGTPSVPARSCTRSRTLDRPPPELHSTYPQAVQ